MFLPITVQVYLCQYGFLIDEEIKRYFRENPIEEIKKKKHELARIAIKEIYSKKY